MCVRESDKEKRKANEESNKDKMKMNKRTFEREERERLERERECSERKRDGGRERNTASKRELVKLQQTRQDEPVRQIAQVVEKMTNTNKMRQEHAQNRDQLSRAVH